MSLALMRQTSHWLAGGLDRRAHCRARDGPRRRVTAHRWPAPKPIDTTSAIALCIDTRIVRGSVLAHGARFSSASRMPTDSRSRCGPRGRPAPTRRTGGAMTGSFRRSGRRRSKWRCRWRGSGCVAPYLHNRSVPSSPTCWRCRTSGPATSGAATTSSTPCGPASCLTATRPGAAGRSTTRGCPARQYRAQVWTALPAPSKRALVEYLKTL